MSKILTIEEKREIKHKKRINESVKHIKYVDEDILLEVSDAIADASNKYFCERMDICEDTIKLILYKDILGELNWINDIVYSVYSVDDVKIEPFDRRLSKEYIDTCMFTPYIDNEEVNKIKEIYKMCLKDGYPKIKNFNKNISKYVKELKDIYKRYVDEIIPMLWERKAYSLKEYSKEIRYIFESELTNTNIKGIIN